MLEVINKYFSIDEYDGGSEPGHEIEKVFDDDDVAHCSGKGVNHTLILKTKGETEVHVTHIIVTAPIRGYGEPVRCGVILPGCNSKASLAAYDDFPVEEFIDSGKQVPNLYPFTTNNNYMEACISLLTATGDGIPLRSIGFKFTESHTTDSNIDISRIVIVGYSSQTPPSLELPKNILRTRLSASPHVHSLDEVIHLLTKVPVVVAVASAERLSDVELQMSRLRTVAKDFYLTKGIDLNDEDQCCLGFAVTTVGSPAAAILTKQFGSPDKSYFGIIHEAGQFVLGEETPAEKEVENFVMNFANQQTAVEPKGAHSCSGTECCGNPFSSLSVVETAAEYNEFIQSSRVCVFAYASWCSVSQSAAGKVEYLCKKFNLPLVAVDVDLSDWFPTVDQTPVITILDHGNPLLTFHSVTAAVLDCDLLEAEMEKVLSQ
eukprot:TRINITY_DN1339_c0_g1_i4.p1 TRINITY_DN1339_c0_g1~~TRINITY_DN1339_c0_g1_i4.p1  ORF type:complete len:445 (+),score=89.27 TRINITY_DN1339_c0_g1_i4:41-1336(+)